MSIDALSRCLCTNATVLAVICSGLLVGCDAHDHRSDARTDPASASSPSPSANSSRTSPQDTATNTSAQTHESFSQEYSVPELAKQTLLSGRFASEYQISYRINPFYLRGDFNGDGRSDVAVLVTHRSSGMQGIAIVHSGTRSVQVIGAGTPLANDLGDFRSIDYWRVQDRGPVDRGVGERHRLQLRGDAVRIGEVESWSALIYWDGIRYSWYHQGD